MDDRYTILISDFHRHGGGHCVYVHTLAKHLLRLGHRPLVACAAGSQLAADCGESGIEVIDSFRFDGGFTPLSFYKDVALANRMKAKHHVDLTHVSGSRDHWVMATADFLSHEKTPLVRTRHSTKPVKNTVFNRILNQRLTSRTICVCQDLKEMLSESPVFRNHEMDVIHNGIELSEFTPGPPAVRVLEEFGVSADDFVIGIVGRLDWDKGHKYLFEAAAPLINGEFGNITIMVVGFGPERGNLERLCQTLGISHRVVFTGARNDMREVMSVFDIGVHPSIGVDTSSYAMKEMMAMEKPIVCSSYGGLKEITDDGLTGIVVPPRDSEAIREGIIRLYRSEEMRRKMGEAARKKVENEFTAEAFARTTLRVYESIIERSRTGERQ